MTTPRTSTTNRYNLILHHQQDEQDEQYEQDEQDLTIGRAGALLYYLENFCIFFTSYMTFRTQKWIGKLNVTVLNYDVAGHLPSAPVVFNRMC